MSYYEEKGILIVDLERPAQGDLLNFKNRRKKSS
jgi:hypothetical protein